MQIQRNSGFTLLEALITVAVLSILVALAVPSFKEMMDRNAVTSAANSLLSSVLMARSEAVKREQRVVIARQGSDWKSWQVFTDANNNHTYDSGTDELIAEHASNEGLSFSKIGNLGNFLSFSPRGRASLQADDGLKIAKGSHTRYLCFSTTGRPRVQEDPCS